MSTEHVWNGLRVRRDAINGKRWFYRDHGTWSPLSDSMLLVQSAVAAELDKLYPLPRTVTLVGATWERCKTGWSCLSGTGHHRHGTHSALALDRIWELENGGNR